MLLHFVIVLSELLSFTINIWEHTLSSFDKVILLELLLPEVILITCGKIINSRLVY